MAVTARRQIQKKLETSLAELPTKKLEQVADFVDYLKSRAEWNATQELIAYPAMRRDVEEGKAQAARGEGRSWREVQRNVRD